MFGISRRTTTTRTNFSCLFLGSYGIVLSMAHAPVFVDLTELDAQDLGAMLTAMDAHRTRLMDVLPQYKAAVLADAPEDYPPRIVALLRVREQIQWAIKVKLGHLPTYEGYDVP